MDAGAPSRTAEYMALFRGLDSARPARRRLIEDRAAARFLRRRLRLVVAAARFAPLGSLVEAFIDRRWPGPRLSGVVRTRVIDDLVSAALGDGCTQLVLLGAGYDTRGTRLPGSASAQVFEVDHPATQARKRAALGPPPSNLRYVSVDFERDSLARALADAGLDSARRSCVVWEGVFSYLSAEAIDRTLAALVEACAEGSLIVLTYVDQGVLEDSGRPARAWITAVNDVAEPFRTGLDPEEAAAFFAARALRLESDETTTEAARRLDLPRAETIPGFYHLATLAVEGRPGQG